MNELRLALSLGALQAIAQGAELVLDVDDTRVYVSCDEATLNHFQQAINQALLHLLPVSPVQH